jgi:hypothetical protein
LQQASAHPERSADERGDQHARNAQRPNDRADVTACVRVRKRGEHDPQRQRHRTDGNPDRDRNEQQREKNGEARAAA